jgi:hypothetical protein
LSITYGIIASKPTGVNYTMNTLAIMAVIWGALRPIGWRKTVQRLRAPALGCRFLLVRAVQRSRQRFIEFWIMGGITSHSDSIVEQAGRLIAVFKSISMLKGGKLRLPKVARAGGLVGD